MTATERLDQVVAVMKLNEMNFEFLYVIFVEIKDDETTRILIKILTVEKNEKNEENVKNVFIEP